LTALATILRIATEAGVTITDEQRIEIEKRVGLELGGEKHYIPKRAARPTGNFVTSVRIGEVRPAAMVRETMRVFGVSRTTAYRWITKR
jgi:hypothetical protein